MGLFVAIYVVIMPELCQTLHCNETSSLLRITDVCPDPWVKTEVLRHQRNDGKGSQ